MQRNGNSAEYSCPVEAALAVVGGKWKPIILWTLADGTKRFSGIQHTVPKITQAMLTKQLRELEHDGIVHRKVYAEVPPRVEYSLTEFGRTAIPVLKSLCDWGDQYLAARHAGQENQSHHTCTQASNSQETEPASS